VLAFFVGVVISVVAAVPALLLMWGGRGSEMKQRLKLWGIGTGIRFAVIGAGLYFLFTQTQIDRIPVVIGVAAAYFVLYIFEVKTTLRT
jgi:hypothetical protein